MDYLKVGVVTFLTGGLYPLSNLIYRKTTNVCKHDGYESTGWEIYKRCLFTNAFDLSHYKLVLLHLQMFLFKKIKTPSNDNLYIVPFLSKSWSVNTNKVHFTEFKYAIQMLTNYRTNMVEANLVVERATANNFEDEKSLLSSQKRLDSLKNCIVEFLFHSTPCWYMKPSVAGGKKVWDFTVDSIDKDITFAWASYDTRAVRLVEKRSVTSDYTDPDNWYLQVRCKNGSYNEETDIMDGNAVYCLENAVTLICHKIPTGFHSWIHFPYSDLASVWVAQEQDKVEDDLDTLTDPFYKLLRYHTLATKWNCINVKSRGIATHNEFDSFEGKNPAVPFVMNTSTILGFIFDSVAENQYWSVHPFFVEMLKDPNSEYFKLPFMRIQFEAWVHCRDFVENSWEQLETGANEFVKWMDRNTSDNANLNFALDQKNIVTRIIWSVGFAHAIDHNAASLVAVKYKECTSVSSYSNISDKWVDGDDEKYDWCVDQVHINMVKYKNFLKVFQDMVLFKNMVSWKNLDYDCPELKSNMVVLKSRINSLINNDLNSFYEKKGFSKYLTSGYLLASQVSASINH